MKLRDRVGAEHPLKADAGCRNTVFNSQSANRRGIRGEDDRSGAQFPRGISGRNPGDVNAPSTNIASFCAEKLTGTQLWRELKLMNQLGVTRGQMSGNRKFRASALTLRLLCLLEKFENSAREIPAILRLLGNPPSRLLRPPQPVDVVPLGVTFVTV